MHIFEEKNLKHFNGITICKITTNKIYKNFSYK